VVAGICTALSLGPTPGARKPILQTVVEAGPRIATPLTDQPVAPSVHALAEAMIANQEAVVVERI
jgi:hypothetical protein